jgi:hypothetical protein
LPSARAAPVAKSAATIAYVATQQLPIPDFFDSKALWRQGKTARTLQANPTAQEAAPVRAISARGAAPAHSCDNANEPAMAAVAMNKSRTAKRRAGDKIDGRLLVF